MTGIVGVFVLLTHKSIWLSPLDVKLTIPSFKFVLYILENKPFINRNCLSISQSTKRVLYSTVQCSKSLFLIVLLLSKVIVY